MTNDEISETMTKDVRRNDCRGAVPLLHGCEQWKKTMGQTHFFETSKLKAASATGILRTDRHVLALIRCVFAVLALVMIASRLDWRHPAFIVAAFYLAFSCSYLVSRRNDLQPGLDRVCHWFDILFLTYWLAVLNLYESPFFAFFLFPVISASRLSGARQARSVLVASIIAHGTAALALTSGPDQILSETLPRTLCLLLLGGAVNFWATSEESAREKLQFLIETNDMWNPGLGTEAMMLRNLKRLTSMYEADNAIIIMNPGSTPGKWKIYSADATGITRTIDINETAAKKLVAIPHDILVAYNGQNSSWKHRLRGYVEFREHDKRRSRNYYSACEEIVNILDTCAFASAPYSQGDGTSGRIYLTSMTKLFSASDIAFLLQVSKVIALVVENMSLAEELIAHAGQLERQKMSRDLHDTSIQPYIGLRLALEALQREAAGRAIARRIDEIIQMTGTTIIDLRSYALALRSRMSLPGADLGVAIARQVDTFSRFYGIKVEVSNKLDSCINAEVAAEVLQMLSEGLSNVLRHTDAKHAFVDIRSDSERISLRIGNEKPSIYADNDANDRRSSRVFTPKSISERASSLGGTISVIQDRAGYTVVRVEIPNVPSYDNEATNI